MEGPPARRRSRPRLAPPRCHRFRGPAGHRSPAVPSGRREARRLAGGHDLGAGPVCAVGPRLGVFLAYAGPKGRALIDRELYLPRSWTGDEARLAAAKVTEGTAFATKPQLLRLMIERAIAAGIPFGWVTADEAYGDNGPLRAFLEEQQVSYVLAVSRDHVITTPAGRRRADALAVTLPGGAWQRVSCGDGAKGRRWYDWALVATDRPEISLLIR